MSKEGIFYTFLATGAFATTGGLVSLFVKLVTFLVNASHDTTEFKGGAVLAIICLVAALFSLCVLFFAMWKVKNIDDKAQNNQDESDKRLQELQELQIALLRSKVASITAQGDVVINDGKIIVDLSNKNVVMEFDSTSQQYGPQIKMNIKSDKAEHHDNTSTSSNCSANASDEKDNEARL